MKFAAAIMYAVGIIVTSFYLLALFGCTKPQDITQPKIVPKLSWETKPEHVEWSKKLMEEIAPKLADLSKAKDITTFCPNYAKLDNDGKLLAFSELMVGMARYESNFKPETEYRECDKTKCRYGSGCFTHPTYGYCMPGDKRYEGGVVVSRGLFQMSISSAKGYGCDLKDVKDLHDPIKNIACAVTILEKQIKKRGLITTETNYWAVIKSNSNYKKITEISERVKKVCK